jgi:long-chain fatty acid transport protein
LLLAVALVAGCPAAVLANGMRLASQDAFASARGEAFVATADNPSAIYYNPAGITQLDGFNVRGGVYGLYLGNSFTAPGGGQPYGDSDHTAAAPQIFCTCTIPNLPVTLGLGIYAPYGASVNWPENTGFREVGTKASLTYIRVNPVAAIKLPGGLSIAGGGMIDYGDIDLEQGLRPGVPYPLTNYFVFKGSGWSLGGNLGLLWQPWRVISFGATFRSMTPLNFNGSNSFEQQPLPAVVLPAQTRFRFPWTAVGGVSLRPTPKWNFEFDADFTDWTSFNYVTDQQQGLPPRQYSLQANLPSQIELQWQGSWMYEFGATRYFDHGWHLSAGYVFNENSEPDTYYNPLVPDMDRYFIATGAGWSGKHLSFDLAYQFGYGPPHTVVDALPPSSPAARGGQENGDGTYRFSSEAVLLSVGLHF